MERRVAGAGGISSDQNRENSGAADKEIDFSYVDDLQLSLDKLSGVVKEIVDVSPKWKGFGRALRLIPASLDNIEAKHASDPHECLHSVMMEYLKKNYDYQTHGHPSWRKITAAISHRIGGRNDDLALKIAQQHSRFSSLYADIAAQRKARSAAPSTQQVNSSTSSKAEKKDIKPVSNERFSIVYRYDIIDGTSLRLHPGEPRTFDWDGYGLTLTVPANAVDSSVPTQYLGLRTCSTEQFKIPENLEFLSGIYWLEYNGRMNAPLTIEIQHCASLDYPSQISTLSFISTEATVSGTPPIELRHCPGGVFPHRESYGSIELSRPSLVAIVGPRSTTKSYRLLNYYMPQTDTTWNMDLIVTYNLEISKQSAVRYYSRDSLSLSDMKVSFTGEEMSLDIPESGVSMESGWNIQGLKCRFQKNKLDYFHPNPLHIPSCRLQLQWKGEEPSPPSFSYTVKVTGFNVTCISIGMPPPKDMRCGANKFASLPRVERRMLERRLDEDSNVLSTQYCLLLTKTQTYIRQNCTRQNVMVCILSMRNVKETLKHPPLNELETAESTDDIIFTLLKSELLSFLRYDVVKRIVKLCCKQSAKLNDRLQKYKEALNDYIKRSVCETSYYHDGEIKVYNGRIPKGMVELLIITDDSWDDFVSFSKVRNLEKTVANVFRISQALLDLQSIEPHCLQLRYVLDRPLVSRIFPLTLEEWNELRSQNIAQVHCGDYHCMMDEKAVGKVFGDIINHENQCTSKDYFVRFGKGLGKEEAALGRVWIEVFGRYDAAVLRLVVDVLGESETPERKLSSALSEMRTIESASRASEAIQKALLSEECLAVLLKDTTDQLALGRELGVEEALLDALQVHFEDDHQLLVGHMMGIWLMEGPEDPAEQLSQALTAVGDGETATKLQLLYHLEYSLKEVDEVSLSTVSSESDPMEQPRSWRDNCWI